MLRYFDTSFVVPTLIPEATSEAISIFVEGLAGETPTISHWVRLEFAALLARDVRMGVISASAAVRFDSNFEAMVAQSYTVLLPDQADFNLAKALLGIHPTSLRAPDALHLAIAKNRRAVAFYSLDKRLLETARSFGLPVNIGISLPGYAS